MRRLPRLLTMVPWLMNRQGIDIEEAAETLGVSVAQIEADLQLLFVCGTPGHLPDDLIEAEWEEGHVYVRNADEISRPLRLTRDEALSLSVGLRTLLAVPGLTDTSSVESALAKLVEATGESTPLSQQLEVQLDSDGADTLATIREALQRKRRVHLTYLVPSRDEMTERDVDPMRLVTADGHFYLEGWCRSADDVRLFRLDRVQGASILDIDADVPAHAREKDLSSGFFSDDHTTGSVVVRLEPSAAWASDYYPNRGVTRNPDGSLDVEFIVGDGRWLERLMLQLGGNARIVRPVALRDAVAAQAHAAISNYDELRRP